MARIDPLPRASLPQNEGVFQGMVRSICFVPNSFLTMARDPLLIAAAGALSDAAWYPKTVSEPLRRLVTFAFSHFAGSRYRAAHCACGAPEIGLSMQKLLSIDAYDSSPVFDAAGACQDFCVRGIA